MASSDTWFLFLLGLVAALFWDAYGSGGLVLGPTSVFIGGFRLHFTAPALRPLSVGRAIPLAGYPPPWALRLLRLSGMCVPAFGRHGRPLMSPRWRFLRGVGSAFGGRQVVPETVPWWAGVSASGSLGFDLTQRRRREGLHFAVAPA